MSVCNELDASESEDILYTVHQLSLFIITQWVCSHISIVSRPPNQFTLSLSFLHGLMRGNLIVLQVNFLGVRSRTEVSKGSLSYCKLTIHCYLFCTCRGWQITSVCHVVLLEVANTVLQTLDRLALSRLKMTSSSLGSF